MIKQRSERKTNHFLGSRAFIVLFIVLCMIGVAWTIRPAAGVQTVDATAIAKQNVAPGGTVSTEKNQVFERNRLNARDSSESVAAFMKVYKVLMSPRCVNCHPAGDVPLQGEDSHLHTMLPQRGTDGKGMYAMKCTNCHLSTTAAGLNMPPGAPDWHLPPANMKMVFQGKTPHQLAKQLVDRKQNGNKSREQLIEHATDELVLVAWNPGEGRALPPISHEEFKAAWETWLKNGAFAPGPKVK